MQEITITYYATAVDSDEVITDTITFSISADTLDGIIHGSDGYSIILLENMLRMLVELQGHEHLDEWELEND